MCAARHGWIASLAAPALAMLTLAMLALAGLTLAGPSPVLAGTAPLAAAPGYAPEALRLGRDLDGDGDPDELFIELEVIEVELAIYPG